MQKKTHSKHINRSIPQAFGHAVCGLKSVFKSDIAFRQELVATVLIVPLAFILGKTAAQIAILIASWVLVLVVEIINSAIEALVDRVSLEIHPLSKKIKDMGAAAVMLSIINAVIVWAVVLIGQFI